MKYIKILLLSLMLFSANAFALSSPSQISAMMDAGHLTQAENALHDVLGAGKNTAKVHYMLAQVYLKEGRLPNARNELARANQMDPEHSYTDNAHYRPIADAIAGHVVNASTGSSVVVVKSDNSFLKVLAGILLLGLLGWGIVAAYLFYRNKREAEAEFNEAESKLTSSASKLVQDIQKAILSEKTSVSPSPAKLSAINSVNFRALNVFDRIKSLNTADISDINQLGNEVADIRQALNEVLDADYSGVAPTVKVTKTHKRVVDIVEPEAAPAPASGAAFAPATAAPVITQAAPQPQTVVVNSNGGMSMTDFLVADMLINEPRRNYDNDYYTPTPAPVVEPDSGNNDNWTSPDTDSGNNDDWSSSSSDSGNNDSWSSSSSDDSSSSSSDWGSSSDFGSSDSGSSDSW